MRESSKERLKEILSLHAAGLCEWIDAQISAAVAAARRDAIEDAANKFDGTTAYNWTAADGYANAFDIASELRYMATEALQEQSK